jgi:predicted DNA-binding transcriptional regulator AlpA
MARKRNGAPVGAGENACAVEPLALRIGDAAKAASISRSLMYRLISQGKGPRLIKIGARTLVTTAELATWLARLQQEAVAA